MIPPPFMGTCTKGKPWDGWVTREEAVQGASQRPLKGAEKERGLRCNYEERRVSISRFACRRP
jgi:hypothetical protein